jgi:hypothetical protein
MTLRAAAALFIAVLVAPSSAAAEFAGIRPEFRISTGPAYSYYSYAYPHNEGNNSVDIASSADGTFVVVWEDLYTYQGGYYGRSNPGIWGRRLDSLGRPLGREFRVSGLGSYARGDAHVSSNPQGQFVVVWDDYYADPDNPYYLGIMAARYNAGGGRMGLPFLVNTTLLDYGGTPKVAVHESGEFMIAWTDHYGDVINGRIFDSNGQPIGPEFQVNEDATGNCCYSGFENAAQFDEMNLAVNSAGNFLVVWSGDTATTENAVRGRLFDGTGAPLTGDLVIGEDSDGYEAGFRPNVTTDGAGRFVVAWAEKYGYPLHARILDGAGAPLGPAFQVNELPIYGLSYGPGVAADAAGNFIVTWDNHAYYEVFGRRFDASGTPIGGQFRVDALSAYGYDEANVGIQKVAASAAGDFVVAWAQYSYFTDYVYGVVGRKLGPAPVPCTAAPKTGCHTSISASGAFTFKKKSNPASSSFTWTLKRGDAVENSEIGDPLTSDSYSFCVYDSSPDPQPLVEAAVPAGGACGAVACWKDYPGGQVDYFDKARYVAGLATIRAKPGLLGRSMVKVTGRGANLALPDTPLTTPVTVQLQIANGACFTAAFSTRVRRNADGSFRANPDL